MKQLFYILLTVILLSCSNKPKASDLLGTWDCISSTNVETGEVSLPEDYERFMVHFTKDSVTFPRSPEDSSIMLNNSFSWKIKGDSIVIDNLISVYIKQLTKTNLSVVYDFLGEQQLNFKKIE